MAQTNVRITRRIPSSWADLETHDKRCPQPKHFLCLDLRTGCLIIGCFGIIISIAFVMISSVAIATGPVVTDLTQKRLEHIPRWTLVLNIVMHTMSCIVYTCLLVGVYEKRTYLVRGAYLSIGALAIVQALVILGLMPNYLGIMCVIVNTVFQVYMTVCIRSYNIRILHNPRLAVMDISQSSFTVVNTQSEPDKG